MKLNSRDMHYAKIKEVYEYEKSLASDWGVSIYEVAYSAKNYLSFSVFVKTNEDGIETHQLFVSKMEFIVNNGVVIKTNNDKVVGKFHYESMGETIEKILDVIEGEE